MQNIRSRNSYYLILGLLVFTFIFSSCKKFITIPPPRNQIVTSQVFADSADAFAALSGIYINMFTSSTSVNFASGSITLYSGLSCDELSSTTADPLEQQFFLNALLSTNSDLENQLWDYAYTYIYQENAVLEGVSASKGLSITAKNQLLGEASFLRAFCYFNLTNLYGPVPLVTTTNYQTSSRVPRSSVDSVYKQILNDLATSDSLLTAGYPSQGSVRPNLYTSYALHAKVLLYRQQWAGADTLATRIINSGMYQLVPLNQVFLSSLVTGNTEAIWQVTPLQTGYETAEGQVFIPTDTTAVPSYPIDSFLLSSFEPLDQRRTTWLDSNNVNGAVYYYPFKYHLSFDGNTMPQENYMMFRLAEQYLIRAEARAEEGSNPAGAVSDINTIRERAGLTDINPSSPAAILTAVYHERQVELFCEWGNRWFDLKRLGLADQVMGPVTAIKGGQWNSNDQLYPIPYRELTTNHALVQNPGY